MIENFFLGLVLFTCILCFIFIGYSLFIFKKVVPKVDYQLNGFNYDYDSWFAQWLRANEYTSYSMLPSRAKKAGIYDQFYSMAPSIRHHFLIWMGIAFIGVILIGIVGIIQNYFLER
jgi:hypothetical protein